MKIALFGTNFSENFNKYIQHLVHKLESEKVEIFIEESFLEYVTNRLRFKNEVATFNSHEDLKDNVDILFSIGGDGTLLSAVSYIRNSNIPILGINTGRLGFISSVAPDQIEQAVNDVLNKNYKTNRRTLLTLNTSNNLFKNKNFALNEVAIVKKDTSSMIKIEAYVDDEFLNTYWADGLVVSTPTGSTGYSLSCNGPVVSPNSKNLVITPIAPHNLNARPMVIPDDTLIELKVKSREKDYLISLDSRITSVMRDTTIFIKKSPFTIKSVIPSSQSFLKTLRTKLLWGEDTRNESNL